LFLPLVEVLLQTYIHILQLEDIDDKDDATKKPDYVKFNSLTTVQSSPSSNLKIQADVNGQPPRYFTVYSI
jgi:hypothetical protein